MMRAIIYTAGGCDLYDAYETPLPKDVLSMTKAERAASIARMLTTGDCQPLKSISHGESEKDCQHCGERYSGVATSKYCSRDCARVVSNNQNRERTIRWNRANPEEYKARYTAANKRRSKK